MSTLWWLHVTGAARLQAGAAPGLTAPQPVMLSRNDAAWLACAALQTGCNSRWLAALVWPAASEAAALNSLRQRVHRLRKATGARLVEMADTLVLAGDLRLHEPRFDGSLAQDATAWDADLLAGLQFDDKPEFAAWLGARRATLAGSRRDALARVASQAQDVGELARALVYAQRLLADDPLSEHGHRRLMRLHDLRGDRAAALAAFERCERVLKDELGVRPGAETLALLAAVEQASGAGGALGPAGARPLPVPASLSRPPRLVGRAAALAELAAAEQAAQVCVLVGEAGLGKSRLLHEALAGRADSVLAQARPGDAAVPYAALARLLRALRQRAHDAAAADAAAAPGEPAPRADGALAAEAGAALALIGAEPGASQPPPAFAPGAQALQSRLEAVLAAAVAAGLALVAADDLHFADRASLEMLLALSQSDALPGLRWLLAHRPVEPATAGEPLHALAGVPQVRCVRLQPLDGPQLHELVSSLALPRFDAALLAPSLLRHTGGNPLFVVETLRAAWAQPADASGMALLPRPQGLAHVIDDRLSRLSSAALALARVAAVAGADFSLPLAEQVLARTALDLADAWQELEAAQVLRGESFSHDLVHDAMRRATPAVIAAHTHGHVAAFLAGRGAEPARVAGHWLAAGHGAEAAAAFRTAAARAQASGRAREHCELLEAAAGALELAGDADGAVQLRIDLVGGLVQSQGPQAALAHVERLLATALRPRQRGHAVCALATALLWAGRPAEAELAARETQALALALPAPGDSVLSLAAARMLAQARVLQGDRDGAVGIMQAWQAAADAADDLDARLQFYGDLTSLLMQADRPLLALPAAQRHLNLAAAADNCGEQVHGLLNLFALRARRGDPAMALALAQRADVLLADPAQSRVLWGWNRTHMGIAWADLGRFQDALDDFEAASAALAAGAPAGVLALNRNRHAELLLTLGQTARAQQLLAAGDAALAGPQRAARLVVRAQLAQALGADDRPIWDEAAALCRQGSGQFDQIRIGAELLRFEPDPALALHAASRLEQQALELEYQPLVLLLALRRLSLVLEMGTADDLARLASWVESQSSVPRSMVYLPQALQQCALAYGRLARPEDAARCLRRAGQWLLEEALPQVPAAFRDGFLERNPHNRRLRAVLARQGAGPALPATH